MEGIFIFDDILTVENYVIKEILTKVNTDDLTKALIQEDEKIRKLFYKNMELKELQELDKKLKSLEAFTRYDKRMAQKKILNIISEVPEHQDTRFQSGFDDIGEFEKYLLDRHQVEEPYGIFDRDITMCRFFDSKGGDKILQDIKLKNEVENMGNIHIPNTNIQLINYSVCPKCGHIFSFKDISDYYLNPISDPLFKTKAQQFREDTRVFCYECETYFLPALIISDGTPKSEVQFLCRIQTMNSIEDYYYNKGIKALSKRQGNVVKKETAKAGKNRKVIRGIRNDVLLKEIEAKPTLISNLLQYTPANIVLNLIEGNNIKNGDLLFGLLQ
jgi:hypothetical protein